MIMNIFQAYLHGFKTAFQSKKMITFLYMVIFILAIIVTIPFLSSLKAAAGNSTATSQLTSDFNFTVIQEIFINKAFSFPTHMKQAVWIMVLFVFLSIFLTGGILDNLKARMVPFKTGAFLHGSAHYFIRFLKLSFYMLGVHLLVALIIYIPFAVIISGDLSTTATEKWFFQVFLVFFCIHMILAIFLIIVTDYTRFRIVEEDTNRVLKSLWMSVRYVTGKFFFTYGLYLMLLVLPIVLFYVLFLLSKTVTATNGLMILVVFVLQQIFIWMRMALRVWTFSSQFEYYRTHLK